MRKYSVMDNDELRTLCIRNNWFTSGSIRQYEKLFYANENGCPLEEIATIIWVCSSDSWCRRDILFELQMAQEEYDSIFGSETIEV